MTDKLQKENQLFHNSLSKASSEFEKQKRIIDTFKEDVRQRAASASASASELDANSIIVALKAQLNTRVSFLPPKIIKP